MKKTLVTALATVGLAAGAFAQGQFSFQATSANGLVSYSTDKATSQLVPTTGIPGGLGSVSVGFYTAPNGTVLSLNNQTGLPDFTGWTFNTLIANIATGAGKTAGKTITVAGAANSVNIEVEAVAWNGAATSWSQAVGTITSTTLLGWSGMVFNGTAVGALGWSQPTGDPTAAIPAPPAGLATGAGGYSGLVLTPVPEPTTIALGGLRAATQLLFRRRK